VHHSLRQPLVYAAFALLLCLQAMIAYLFGCELKDRGTGLVAAALMAVVPGACSSSSSSMFALDV
jgi:asparagine N-glycosylation enzyme membrane subunit Stt3